MVGEEGGECVSVNVRVCGVDGGGAELEQLIKH